jgi:hypothetical protein
LLKHGNAIGQLQPIGGGYHQCDLPPIDQRLPIGFCSRQIEEAIDQRRFLFVADGLDRMADEDARIRIDRHEVAEMPIGQHHIPIA